MDKATEREMQDAFESLLRNAPEMKPEDYLRLFTEALDQRQKWDKQEKEEKEQLLNIARTNVVDAMIDYLEILGVIEDVTDKDKAELDKIFKESEQSLVKDIGDMKAIYGLGKAMGLF